tara:strand:+ start:505 stop:777 length:273 start_codon:yes stop_codon:yes gene_type:complete
VITEQDLIELGFERETTSYNDSITSNVDGYFVEKEDIAFYTLMIDELEFSSNNSDEWDNELEVTITDNAIVFRNLEDLRNVIDILKRNQE